jgi:hypothetical protein
LRAILTCLKRSGGKMPALAALFGLALLAGCQAVDTEGALDVAPDNTPAPQVEVAGSGPIQLLMPVARSSQGTQRTRANDAVAGARMAIEDLGAGQVSLRIVDTAGAPATARTLVEQAQAAGTPAIIGPTDADSVAAIAALPAARRPPVLSLASEASAAAGVYAFNTDAIESAVEGVRVAAGAGHSRVIVIVPDDFSVAALARFRAGAGKTGARIVEVLRYPLADTGVGPALQPHAEKFREATAAVIFGTGRAPVTVANAMVAGGLGSTIAALVGNSSWPRQLYAEPLLDGALVALTDQDSLRVIADRYQTANGRALSLDAAYAYDAVAVAAGLLRAGGAKALTASALTVPTGFRGAGGMFRLHRDGTVERRHAVYRIERGNLQLVQGPGEGF